MSVPPQSFYLINTLSCIIEYDYVKSIYKSDVFLHINAEVTMIVTISQKTNKPLC